MKRKELDDRGKNDHDFHQRQLIAIVFIHDHMFYERSIVQLPCGGKMEKKKNFEKKWVHPDAQKAYEEKVEKVSELYSECITNR